MKKRTLLLVIMCMVAALAVTACTNDSGDKNGGDKTTTAPESKNYNVKLYFANEEYIETGDESKGMLAAPIDWKLTTTAGNQYKDVLDIGLRDVSKVKKSGEEKYATVIGDNIQFNSVLTADGTATVDLKSEGLTGGSLDELLLVNQIVETLTHSFKEVKDVQFLVDGEKTDSLMGHMDTSKPLKSSLDDQE